MTRDEIRSLIGAYATSSLSAAERKALFEAALDDQELFDELAREQALKELLDEPGVKARLLTALAPRRRRNVWVWAAAGAFAVAVIAGIVLWEKPQPPEREIAQVIAPRAATEPPTPLPVAPSPVAPPPAVAPPVIVKKAAPMVQAPAPNPVPKLGTGTIVAPAPASLAEPAPVTPAPVQAPAAASIAALGGVAGGVAGGAPAGGGGGRGGRGGAVRLLPRLGTGAMPSRFAFDYSVTPQGVLRIVAASNGFLTVDANTANALSVLFSNRPLQAGSVTEVPLPADCVSALVLFSAREMPPPPLNINSPMDPPSGTKSDPNPTPESVLTAHVPVMR